MSRSYLFPLFPSFSGNSFTYIFFVKVKDTHPNVDWVAKARWVKDDNIWTSSGISAGIDLTFAWIAEVFGEETAQNVADRSEYERNVDSGNDRYAERWGAK